MYSRKDLKTRGKSSVKRHWLMWILVCILGMCLAGETVMPRISININEGSDSETAAEASESQVTGSGSAVTGLSDLNERFAEILADLGADRLDERRAQVSQDMQNMVASSSDTQILGRSRGVLSEVVNRITSGSFLVILGTGLRSVFGSGSVSRMILIIGSMILSFALWVFIKNTYQIVMARMFLEGRCYDKVHLNRFLFLFRSGYWIKASLAVLRMAVYRALWSLTVIGGVIKHFSYFLVPYILAENPSISGKDAIKMSRHMMNGHKWQCFVLELSFIGWEILNIFTLGILRIAFIEPYKNATYSEYYAWLRDLSKEDKIEGTDRLNDTYLYQKASDETLNAAYSDVVSVLDAAAKEKGAQLTGIYRILAQYFGITLRNTEAEQLFTKKQAAEQSVYLLREELNGKAYPHRLSISRKIHKETAGGSVSPLRTYSIWSILMLYFIASFIGWLWEVSLHLISDGSFVNRGVLHGPWLPIYGTGCVVILILLYRFRKNVLAEFFTTILVCGIVEYGTAYYLEMAHDGKKWWDYSGYFLNLHGRICAEGLLVFGLGSLIVVYLVAPILDNFFLKINRKVLITVCLVLLMIFSVDNIYSGKHPNEGEGITSVTSYALPYAAGRILDDAPDR